uniref:Uncharacterized protein n=1 Tax=Sus scrofa TaxID=9823 RepID=A0A4X1UVT3_PIG
MLNPLDTLYHFILSVSCERGTAEEMDAERLIWSRWVADLLVLKKQGTGSGVSLCSSPMWASYWPHGLGQAPGPLSSPVKRCGDCA